MLKQEKKTTKLTKISIKNFLPNTKNISIKKFAYILHYSYLFSLSNKLQLAHKYNIQNKYKHKLNIKVTGNNIFCTLINLKKKKIFYSGSSGIFKIRTSKKQIRYTYKLIIKYFFEKLKLKKIEKKEDFFLSQGLIINLLTPSKFRKRIIKSIYKNIKVRKKILINIQAKKCFNGCRALKKRRKKRFKFHIFK